MHLRPMFNKKSGSSTNLLEDPIDSSLRLFAIPMAFSFLVNMAYSLIDRYYVSRLGDAAIAAIGASDQVTFFLFTLASGFAVGTGIIVARRFGEGQIVEAERIAAQALVGMLLLAGSITVLLYAVMQYIPVLMRMNPDVSAMALSYMSTLYIGFTANLINFQAFSIVRSTGNPMFPMIVLVFTTIVNAVLAPFLIFGIGPFPEMGMAGAGLATAIAQITGTILSMWAITTGRTTMHLRLDGFTLQPSMFFRIGKLGLPASLQMLSVSVNRAIIFVIVGGFGTSATAAYTLGLNIDMVVFMSVFAFGVAVEVATGQNLGAGKMSRVFEYHRSSMKQTGILMIALAIVVWFFGEYFVRLYTHTPSTLSDALSYMHTTVIGYVFFAVGLCTVRVISGAGATFLSMFITAGCLLGVQLPLSYILAGPLNLGPQGVWDGLVIGYAVFAVVALLVFRQKTWIKTRV